MPDPNPISTPSVPRQPQDHLPRRLRGLPDAAAHRGVSLRTMHRWVSEGYVTGYRVPGMDGVHVDLDELDAALRRLPASKVRQGYGSFGPKARIVTLPVQAVVVDRRADQQ